MFCPPGAELLLPAEVKQSAEIWHVVPVYGDRAAADDSMSPLSRATRWRLGLGLAKRKRLFGGRAVGVGLGFDYK